MIRVKSSNVRLNLASEPIRRLLFTLGRIDGALSGGGMYDGDLVVTSGNDSKHGPTSRHYTDEAIDVRVHNFASRQARRDFRQWWELELGPQFRVLLEADGTPNAHLHAQVRKGHRYESEGF